MLTICLLGQPAANSPQASLNSGLSLSLASKGILYSAGYLFAFYSPNTRTCRRRRGSHPVVIFPALL